jgi:hypothetical protein
MSATHLLRQRFRSNGADLRLGLPLDTQTLCRFKEVLRDVMREKGFLEGVTRDEADLRRSRQLTLTFTVIEVPRSRPTASAVPLPSPAERCSR